MRAAIAAVMASLAGPLAASDILLDLPLACSLGTDCFVEDYVDARPGPGQRDYLCGQKSRHGHRGTDFALLDFAQRTEVRAAAPGRVAAIRTDMPDIAVRAQTRAALAGRECGNAVRIDHGLGWQTLYCHLEQGSIGVALGDEVARGAALGLVGLSGLTNFPHLHFAVLHRNQVVDPFAPNAEECGSDAGNLWREEPPYDSTGLALAGFALKVPALFSQVLSGDARKDQLAPHDQMVLYVRSFLAEPGDVLDFSISGPDGSILAHRISLPTPRRDLYRAAGRKAPPDGWPTGRYLGRITLRRGARIIAVRHTSVTVTSDGK